MELRVAIATDADLPALSALRDEVFVIGQGVDPAIEHDELDAVAVHAVAYDGDRLVGTGRLIGDPPGPARIGRMAVDARVRGLGVGVAVLGCLERVALRRGHGEIVLHAQAHALGFYERAGYLAEGPRFVEAGIEHQAMRKVLPFIRPVADTDSAALIALIGDVWSEYPGCVLDVDGEEPWLRAPAAAYAAWGGVLWVVELPRGGEVVACVGVKPIRHAVAELKSLYVSAKARRRGLGEVLAAVVEDEVLKRGGRRIELWSDTRFADAHRLYTRLGYTRLPETRDLHDLSNTIEYAFTKQLA